MNEDYMFEDEEQYIRKDYEVNQPPKEQSMGPAIFSLVLGIIALVFFLLGINIIFAIASVVLGIISLTVFKNKRGKIFAISGILTSVISVGMFIFSWAFIFSNSENIAKIADDPSTMELFYDYYGITMDDIYGDDYDYIFENPDGDDLSNMFDGIIDEDEHPDVDFNDTL